MMYPEKESGFDRILYQAPYLDGQYVIIVCYQNVMKDGNSYIGKITHNVEKNEYELQTEIRNRRDIIGERRKERFTNEKEARENLMNWIKRNRIRSLF